MRKLVFLSVVIAFTFIISGYKSTAENISQQQRKSVRYAQEFVKIQRVHAEKIAAEQARIAEEQRKQAEMEQARIAAQKAAQASQNASQDYSTNTSCREAINIAFPAPLRDGARIVLVHENRQEDPLAVGKVNRNGSRDYGCFQINNHAHPNFFATQDWRDPVASAKYAYQIYEERQSLSGNGWRAWYAVQGILW